MADVSAVATHDLTKLYQQGRNVVRALRGVSIRLEQGEFAAVVGRSGSGKTTLLDIVGLLLRPTAGQVLLDGTDVGVLSERERTRVRRQKVGFVFQEYNLLPTLTALENVVLPLQYERGADLAAGLQRAAHLLDLVELGDRLHHRPDAMSGGEQQRTAIARSLINSPALVLADEPTASVDSETTAVLMRLMRHLNHSEGTTFALVTHDLELAGTAQRIITLRDGEVESVTSGTLQVAVPEPVASTSGPGVGLRAPELPDAVGLPGAPSPPGAIAPPPVLRPPAAAPPPAPPVPPGPAPQMPTSRELLRSAQATPPVAPVPPTPPASVSHGLSAEWITSERLLRNSLDGAESLHTGPLRGDGSEQPARRRVALIAAGAGAGQTTAALLLGHQLAGRWGGGVVALDLDPVRPRLAERIGWQQTGTVDDIVAKLGRPVRYSDIRSVASQAPSGLEVIASASDEPGSLDRAVWEQLLTALESFYDVVLVEAGAVDPHQDVPPLLPAVDQLIVCAWPRADLLHATAAMLASLERWGLSDLAVGALVVLSGAAPGRPHQRTSVARRRTATDARMDAWCEHFRDRCRDVVRLPYDRLTAASERMLLEELGEETREASEHLAELAAGTARSAGTGRSYG